MDDTNLCDGFWENRLNRFGEAFQAVHAGNIKYHALRDYAVQLKPTARTLRLPNRYSIIQAFSRFTPIAR
jgi:hypothetical protein